METESPPTGQFFIIIRAQNAAKTALAEGAKGKKATRHAHCVQKLVLVFHTIIVMNN